MEKQFATFEIALKLKELGFDEECFGYYTPMKNWMMKGKYSDEKLHFHGPNWANNDNTMYFMYVQNSFGDRNSTVKNSSFTKAIHNIAVPLWQQAIDFCDSKELLVGTIIVDNLYKSTINKINYETELFNSRNESIKRAIEFAISYLQNNK